MRNKRASLEISIQAIVIVVLAMTLLGLGLGFVKGMFKSISSTTEDVTEQVRQKVIDDLVQSDKKISFPKTEVLLDRGGALVLTVGIKNKNNKKLVYNIKFSAVSGPNPNNPDEVITFNDPDVFKSWFQIALPPSGTFTIAPADFDVRNVRLTVPKNVVSGSYAFTFDVLDTELDEDGDGNPDNYAQKEFFIVIRG